MNIQRLAIRITALNLALLTVFAVT